MQANEEGLKRILLNKCKVLRMNVLNMMSAIPKKMYSACKRWLKNIPFDAWTSAMAVTIVLEISALSAFALCILAIVSWVSVTLTYYYVRQHRLKTNVLAYWMMWWMIYMFAFMELTMPLLELLPEEHGVLFVFASFSLYAYVYNIRNTADNKLQRDHYQHHEMISNSNDVVGNANITGISSNNSNGSGECTLIEIKPVGVNDYEVNTFGNAQNKYCKDCRKFVSWCATHCHFCDCCVLQRYHHSLWLNCCITQANYPFYIISMALAIFTLSFYANIVMTSICHPFVLLNVWIIWILMPDDCHEAFDVYIFGINFVLAVHALIMAIYMGITFIRHMYLTYRYKRPIFEQILKSYQH